MRLHDWPERLSEVVAAARDRPFEYGTHDCCLFAADCIEAVTGRDLAAVWRGQYATLEDGLKLAKARNLVQLAAKFFKPIAPVFAHRGDIAVAPIGVLRRGKRELVMLVFDGVYLRGAAGMQVERHLATTAWRVA